MIKLGGVRLSRGITIPASEARVRMALFPMTGDGVLGLRVGTCTQGERSRHMAFGGKRTTNNGTGHEHDIACEG